MAISAKPSKKMSSRNRVYRLIALVGVLAVALLVASVGGAFLVIVNIQHKALYVAGYCEAAGGAPASTTTCDVHGRALPIPENSVPLMVSNATAYASGFCTALDGVVVNPDTCNVDGQLVTVTIPATNTLT